jgi:hypothetical protein
MNDLVLQRADCCGRRRRLRLVDWECPSSSRMLNTWRFDLLSSRFALASGGTSGISCATLSSVLTTALKAMCARDLSQNF